MYLNELDQFVKRHFRCRSYLLDVDDMILVSTDREELVRAQARRFQAQYHALVRRAGERCLAFCQVGRFVEFRGPQRGLAERTLGLRRVYLPRAGYAFAAGFPVPPLAIYKTRAIERGVTVVEARERLVPLTAGGKARRPIEVLVPVRDAGLGRAGSGQGSVHRAVVSRR